MLLDIKREKRYFFNFDTSAQSPGHRSKYFPGAARRVALSVP